MQLPGVPIFLRCQILLGHLVVHELEIAGLGDALRRGVGGNGAIDPAHAHVGLVAIRRQHLKRLGDLQLLRVGQRGVFTEMVGQFAHHPVPGSRRQKTRCIGGMTTATLVDISLACRHRKHRLIIGRRFGNQQGAAANGKHQRQQILPVDAGCVGHGALTSRKSYRR
jgi:hypothetical protein